MDYTSVTRLLHVSDQMIAFGLIIPANALPDRVSPIQTALDRIASGVDAVHEPPRSGRPPKRPESIQVEIALAPGTAAEVAEQYGVTISTVYTYRTRHRDY